jgi:ribonuclease HIII
MHNTAFLNVKNKINDINDTIEVILDQFCEKHHYFNYLKNEKNVYRNITFSTKAESKYISVALASIFARYIFITKFNELEQQYNIKLEKGSGEKADNIIKTINKKNEKSLFHKIAKTNFKNFEKLNIEIYIVVFLPFVIIIITQNHHTFNT